MKTYSYVKLFDTDYLKFTRSDYLANLSNFFLSRQRWNWEYNLAAAYNFFMELFPNS